MARALACVYRHPIPEPRHLARTHSDARRGSMLERYLARYEDSFYDWGDDPSFFAATDVLGSPTRATWGVCRANVRRMLAVGDFVAFFCARQRSSSAWDYFYIGVATVGDLVDRQTLWAHDDYAPFRRFLNVLARPRDGALEQHESVHRYHDDWLHRAEAPYVVFDQRRSRLELDDPLPVATFDRAVGGIEKWNSGRAEKIGALVLPIAPTKRGLRTTNPYIAHPPLNLARNAARAGGHEALRSALIELVE
jgi:hypothetical protein